MQFIDIVTALTIAGILGILVLYVTIVYKKGWLKKELHESDSYFLCPNAKCRRVFKDPVWLTDLSQNPPESYQACPHCSTNLQTSPSFVAREESPKLENAPKMAPTISDFRKAPEPLIDLTRESTPQKTEIIREVRSPIFQSNVQSKQEKASLPVSKSPLPSPEPSIKDQVEIKPTSPEDHPLKKSTSPQVLPQPKSSPKPSIQPPPNIVEVPKKPEQKRPSEIPRACSHHFGYVKTLPKNTSIPDECLWCPWIVECLTGGKEVEA